MCTTLLALVVLCVPAVAPVGGAEGFRDAVTGIEFPATLGSLNRGQLTRYNAAELGLSVRYAGPNLLKADIYLYTSGLQDLGTGEKGSVVQEHFAGLKQAVFMMEEKGNYKDVKVVDEGEMLWNTAAGRVPVLHAVLQYSEVGTGSVRSDPRISHIYLATYKDHFVKIRYTYLAEHRAQAEATLRYFLADCRRLLK
jgi:hypothetical protein